MHKDQIKTGIIALGLWGTTALTSLAVAGGFAIREQSTTGLGSAFAGIAAENSPAAMYWNGATITQVEGLQTESSYSVILPNTSIDPVGAEAAANIGRNALVGASAVSWQMNDRLFLGLSLNSPFGLVTKPDRAYSGSLRGITSKISTFNASPTVAYKLTPNLSVSAGLQVQYIDLKLNSSLSSFTGDDIGFGATAGLLFTPTATTTIGLGYRSAIDHKLKGDGVVVPLAFNNTISSSLKTPDMITASLRQKVTASTTLLGTVEWANWSNLKELRINLDGTGGAQVQEDFLWKDSWLLSAGLEHQYSDTLVLRAGLGFEKSPVPDATRGVRLPDSDRTWLSLGASYKYSEFTTLNFGYSHIFMKDADIALAAGGGLPAFNADTSSRLDIFSIGYKMKW